MKKVEEKIKESEMKVVADDYKVKLSPIESDSYKSINFGTIYKQIIDKEILE